MVSIAANNLLQVIKKIAKDEREASRPCDFVLGTVADDSPLKIKISQKLVIGKEFFYLTETADSANLKTGDTVVMIRRDGGQKYLIIDKAVN